MPRSRPRKSSGKEGTQTLLSKPEKIDNWLKIMVETFPSKELSPDEIVRWHQDLGNFPIHVIDWAFDNWRRNGHFFPVPGDILEQCEAWSPAIEQGRCTVDCRERHGKGLGESDVIWLWRSFSRKVASLSEPRSLTDAEKQELLEGLYQFRGARPDYA